MKGKPKNGKLTVQLYENVLTLNKDDYTGKILLRGVVSQEELADMARLSDDRFTPEQLISAYNLMNENALACLADGFSVRLGACTARPVINGVFSGERAKFNPDLHYVSISFSATPHARQVIKTAIVEVVGVAKTGCVINRVLDVRTGEENGALTCGRNLKIFGSRLTIEGTLDAVGVCFISAADETLAVRVDDADIVDNNPSQLTVVIPNLETGEWFVQVTTQYSGKKGSLLKEPRICRFDIPLAVV